MKKLVLIAAVTAVAVFGVMASAGAASDSITLNATVNSRIVVTAPADHNFGAVNPDAGVQTHNGNVNVRSNVAYTLTESVVGSALFASPTDTDGSFAKAPSAAGRDHVESWTFDPAPGGDWADAGAYSATFTYTTVP